MISSFNETRPFSSRMINTTTVTVLILLAGVKIITASEEPRVLTALRGHSVTIPCPHNYSDDENVFVTLKTKTEVCKKNWNPYAQNFTGHQCNTGFTMLWNNKTKGFSVTVLSLQLNYSDIYTCEVWRMTPPPTILVTQTSTSLQVTAHPTVSVSHVEESSGPPILLCSAQDFYPEGIMQVWLRDGQPLNATQGNISANVDGSFSISTPLPLSSEHTEDVLYSCWVNHSTLSKPITASYNFSPTGDNTAVFKDLRIIATVCGVAFAVIVFGLVIVIRFTNFKKVLHCSRSRTTHTHGPESTIVDTEFYSTLGNHHPVLVSSTPTLRH